MTQDPHLLTPAEAGERLGVSSETVRRWIRAGLIGAVIYPSGRMRLRSESVDEMLAQRVAS
jgi:excisionase family DNA binding protein